MKKNAIFFFLYMCCLYSAIAQKRKLDHFSIAFTNMNSAMPFASFTRLFTKEIHPGVEVETGLNWRIKKKHDWFQTFHAGYSYHRWVQHSFVVYSQFGYRYKLPEGFNLETKLGGGYMRAIIATEVFSDGQEDGKQYGKITSGRSQTIFNLSFNLNKQITDSIPIRVFLEYEQRLQTPFIHYYVPLLPYNYIKFGITIPILH